MRTHNLPHPLSSFVGRQDEIAQLQQLLSTTRLLTLAGPGGIGKTRLAQQFAARLVDAYPHGIWLVELASVSSPDLVAEAVADVVVPGQRSRSTALERLLASLADKALLLLLDNCEHLLAACVDLVAALLRACSQVHILATSREPLDVTGEVTFRVPPLSLPDVRLAHVPAALARSDAVRLFVDRVTAHQPAFTVTATNAEAIVETCRRLDGIPLALELAAAHVPSLGTDGVVRHMDDRLQLLVGRDRSAPSRHKTLRATIDWSYALLDSSERALFDRMSVFAGPCSLDAVEAVCDGDYHHLEGLIAKSLVITETPPGGVATYHQLETLRAYGAERLADRGETDATRRKHAVFYTELAEQGAAELNGPAQVTWLERLEQTHDDLRLALGWALGKDLTLGLRLALALNRFWGIRGHLIEGGAWFDRLLRGSVECVPSTLRAQAFTAAGILAWHRGESGLAETHLRSALEQLDHVPGDSASARPLYELAKVMVQRGDYASARSLGDQALAVWQRAGDRWGIAVALNFIGELEREAGDLAAARRSYAESQRLFEALGDQRGMAITTQNLGIVAIEQRDFRAARALHARALPLKVELGDREGVADSLVDVAYLTLLAGDAPRAVRWCAAAKLAHQTIGAVLPTYEGLLAERTVERARTELGNSAFAKHWQEGERLGLDAAVCEALETDRPTERPIQNRVQLTPRQRDVAALVAQGLSNRDIAAKLVIAEGTAERHVADIMSKLGLASRVHLAAWAIDHGLRPDA